MGGSVGTRELGKGSLGEWHHVRGERAPRVSRRRSALFPVLGEEHPRAVTSGVEQKHPTLVRMLFLREGETAVKSSFGVADARTSKPVENCRSLGERTSTASDAPGIADLPFLSCIWNERGEGQGERTGP